MATDLSLLRLRELLTWLTEHCNPKSIIPPDSVDFDAATVKVQLEAWGVRSRLSISECISGAAVLCERNGIFDAAEHFRQVGNELERRWRCVFFPFLHDCDGDGDPSLLLITITDVGRYARALLEKSVGYANSLAESVSAFQEPKGECELAVDEPELVTRAQMQSLCGGIVGEQTILNVSSASKDCPQPVIKRSGRQPARYEYQPLREWFVGKWSETDRFIPRFYSDAKLLLNQNVQSVDQS